MKKYMFSLPNAFKAGGAKGTKEMRKKDPMLRVTVG